MRKITDDAGVSAFLKLLKKRSGGVSPEIAKTVERIISSVRKEGDTALKRFTERFDGHRRIVIRPAEIKNIASAVDKKTLQALRFSEKRIRRFHEHQKEKSWSFIEKGIHLGQIVNPLERAGAYVPGGKASYPSTVLMNVIPAQVAGVKEIAVAVPAPRGKINPTVAAAIDILGVTEVYLMGGAQAIAAFAYGTKTVRKVDKITGPGNIYVATAKKMVYGEVDIDIIAGPSEILIIADSSANPAFIAADLLSQAEHDELASAILITDSESLADKVGSELISQIAGTGRKDIAKKSLRKYGAVIIVKDLERAVEIANLISPEHLEIMTASPRKLLPRIKNAGAIFLGSWTPEPLGDYAAGPNHTLPTGQTARWASALGVYDFVKRTSLLEFKKEGFDKLSNIVAAFAESEGLDAHARAVRIRMKS